MLPLNNPRQKRVKFPAPSNSFGVELMIVVSVTPMHVIYDFQDKELELHFPARAQRSKQGWCVALFEIRALSDRITREVENEIRHR